MVERIQREGAELYSALQAETNPTANLGYDRPTIHFCFVTQQPQNILYSTTSGTNRPVLNVLLPHVREIVFLDWRTLP
jgi:hypothetical protein